MTRRESAKPRSELAVLLKFLRRRVDPNVRDLGSYTRLPSRRGKRVTQEEVSEAIGVSREWYSLLECGAAPTRASTSLLDRLADALMVTPAERVRLFHLAVPELGRVQLRDDSVAALEAFSRLRWLMKRLSTATSIDDVFTTVNEHIAGWFDDALLVNATGRRESGLWDARLLYDRQNRSFAAVIRDLQDLYPTPEKQAALNLHPQLAHAGDLGSWDLYPLPLQRELLKVCACHGVASFAWRCARVRSRTGFIGGLYIAHQLGHSYSASDDAVLGAFAELTSLALS
jgi:transcriptional regulator with XRE-family HTH domain